MAIVMVLFLGQPGTKNLSGVRAAGAANPSPQLPPSSAGPCRRPTPTVLKQSWRKQRWEKADCTGCGCVHGTLALCPASLWLGVAAARSGPSLHFTRKTHAPRPSSKARGRTARLKSDVAVVNTPDNACSLQTCLRVTHPSTSDASYHSHARANIWLAGSLQPGESC